LWFGQLVFCCVGRGVACWKGAVIVVAPGVMRWCVVDVGSDLQQEGGMVMLVVGGVGDLDAVRKPSRNLAHSLALFLYCMGGSNVQSSLAVHYNHHLVR